MEKIWQISIKSILIFFILYIIFLLNGCTKNEILHIYSIDKSQCITIINTNNVRYIINGNYQTLPDYDYIKLDIQQVDSFGDALHICWKNEKYDWYIIVNESKVIETKLDTTRFQFSNELPKDDRGIPTELKFVNHGCAIFSFYFMELTPDKGAIVEFE